MAICQKCGFVFVGLGHDNSPMQNIHTGQWICVGCYLKLDPVDREKYVLI